MKDMKLEITYLPTTALTPYENNAKLHPQEQIEQIKASIVEFGMDDPIAVYGDKNIIIEGHGRLVACQQLGIKEVPVIRLDHLTEDQRKAYTIVHNKLTMSTGFDMEILKSELNDIELNMDGFGFEDMEIDNFDLDDDEAEEEEAPEAPEEPTAKRGDVYRLGDHVLMCGDSMKAEDVEKLMDGAIADIVFTDPPYGMSLDTDWSKMKSNREKGFYGTGNSYDRVIGDNEDFNPKLITTIFDNFDYCKEIFIFGGDYYPDLLKGYKQGNFLIWDKRSNDGMDESYVRQFDKMFGSQFEVCWSKNKHRKEIVRVRWAGIYGLEGEFDRKRVHPTQKPVKLARWFLEKYSKAGDNVVDLYGGSGSTLIACEQLGRKCRMMEIDPRYVDVIIKRFGSLTGKKAEKVG